MAKRITNNENQSKPDSPKLSKAKKVFNRMTLMFVLIVAAGGTAIYINNVMRYWTCNRRQESQHWLRINWA